MELAPSPGYTCPLRGCRAQPGPTSLAALSVVMTQPDPETIYWWVNIWGRLCLWHSWVQGTEVPKGALLFLWGRE